MSDLRAEVHALIGRVFRIDSRRPPASYDVDSIQAWDSLGHIGLILELQRRFGVRLPHEVAVTLLSEDKIVAVLQNSTLSRD